MKTIALTAAALLVAAGSAFAGSGSLRATSANEPAANVDSTYTSSVNSWTVPGTFVNHPTADTAVQDHRTHWGNN